MKKIIKHFCEAYGINFDFGNSRLYNYKKKINKKPNLIIKNKFSNFPSHLMNPRRSSVDVKNAQLTMFKHFPKQTTLIATKTNVEKNIEKLIPEKFKLNDKNNNLNVSNNNINNMQLNKSSDKNKNLKRTVSPIDNENPIDCSVSMIKLTKKETILGYGHPNYIRENNNLLDIASNDNGKSILISQNDNNEKKNNISKNINQKSQNHLDSNKKMTQYGEEETNNLIKFFGTPYYPEDINDEVYPGENFEILSPRGNNLFEQEYSPINNLLLSCDITKNNIQKLKNKSLAPPSFEINNKSKTLAIPSFEFNNKSNNFTINNNYITNNVINHINTQRNKVSPRPSMS